jgi:histone-lysine N-methyltransferase SETMAR
MNKILLHDNARPHTNLSTRETVATMGWTVLPHSPHSTDLTPSEFHFFFVLLKDALRGRLFADDKVKQGVREELTLEHSFRDRHRASQTKVENLF